MTNVEPPLLGLDGCHRKIGMLRQFVFANDSRTERWRRLTRCYGVVSKVLFVKVPDDIRQRCSERCQRSVERPVLKPGGILVSETGRSANRMHSSLIPLLGLVSMKPNAVPGSIRKSCMPLLSRARASLNAHGR